MRKDPPPWDWPQARRRANATGKTFNAGALPFDAPLMWRTKHGDSMTIAPIDLRRLVRRLVASLEHLDVKRGDRVLGLVGRRPEAFAAAIACWRLGAIYVPLFTSFGVEAIRVRIEDAQPRAAIVEASQSGRIAEAASPNGTIDILVIDAVMDGAAALTEDTSDFVTETVADDPATIVYTSGTTSRPKGCVMPHRALLSLWPYVERGLELAPEDVFFSTADPGWSFGLMTTGLAPLSLGFGRCLFEPGFDAEAWWTAIETWGVTHLATAPTGLRQLAAAGDSISDRKLKLRAVTTAGEALTADVVQWFNERLDVIVRNTYGLSELGMITANVPTTGETDGALAIGYPLPGFTVDVVDEEGRMLDADEEGRLAVRDNGELLSTTYWGRDDDWAAHIRNGWWITEDLVRRDADGRFWYVDRHDDIVVTAGYNVSPSEVERAILRHPLITEVACVGMPDSRKGQVVSAHVVLRAPAAEDDLLSEVRRLVGEQVAWYAAPRRLQIHDTLPRTESGKIRRRELRDDG